MFPCNLRIVRHVLIVTNNIVFNLNRNIKDALYDNEVYECFRNTLARAKKVVRGGGAGSGGGSTAAETKSAMEEFEKLMERIHSAANGEEQMEEEDGQGDGATADGAPPLDMGDVAVALRELDDDDEDCHG